MVRQPSQTNSYVTLATQAFSALLGGVLVFFVSMLIWTLGYQLVNAGHIFPGVSVAGVDLSGMSPAQAAVTLNSRLSFPYTGQILLRDGEKLWVASPAELGMVFDATASAQAAYAIGRTGGLFGAFADQLDARRSGLQADAVVVLDQNVTYTYLQRLAAEIDQPPIEAMLEIQGTDVVAQPGQVGRYLNVDSTLIALNNQLKTFRDGEVNLFIDETQPELLDVSSQADAARRILSAPLTLILPGTNQQDPGPWNFDVQTVANMIVVQKISQDNGTQLEVTLDPTTLDDILQDIAAQVDRSAENARFIFNDETRQLDLLRPAVTGRRVDLDASKVVIHDQILAGAHQIPVQVISDEPEITDYATAADLGITELVRAETSYFYGSSAERIQNISAAASAFHGVLIAPGETFSMASMLGDISLENGYAEALIIYGGRTIKGVGGGVCQVSTTLFRTAFFAGFPINERHSHAYRVYYYEQSASGARDPQLVGLDATVYVPVVDFKFTNDTPYWLLMETYTDAAGRNLTWKFYSTSDNRAIDWTTTGPINTVEAPKPLLVENEELGKNEVRQVDWAAQGADVSITRTVYRDGGVLFNDVFNTHYEPWQAVCEYGPGTEDAEKQMKKAGICQ